MRLSNTEADLKKALLTKSMYSEPFQNCIPMHTQKPVIFTKIGKPCVTLEIQNPGILIILKYSEP